MTTRTARAMAPVATAPVMFFERRRPTLTLKRNPRNGRSGIRYSTRSPLQRREGIRVQRFLVPEERDDNRQPDGRLGRRHGHDKEHDDLPVHALKEPVRGHK